MDIAKDGSITSPVERITSWAARDEKGNDKIQDGNITLMDMTLRRRYCVRTETMI
jgi:hypothetical protein